MRARFVVLISVLTILAFYTDYRIFKLMPGHPVLAVLITSLIFLLIVGWQVIHRMRPDVFEARWFHALSWAASIAMGLWATFIMVSIPINIIELALSIFTDWQTSLGGTLAASSAGVMTALGFVTVIRGPHVKAFNVEFIDNTGRMPPTLKIAQISDLHVGATIRKNYVKEVVRRTNDVSPDLVVLTGDFADGDADAVFPALRELQELRTRYGVYYVTGNHEYYWGAKQLIEKIQSLGIHTLLNSHEIIKIDNARLQVIGVTDPAGKFFYPEHRPDLKKAIETSEAVDFRILLAHRPGVCEEAEKLDIDLQFSGHTHAGQFFPFSLLIPLAHRYYRGLNHHGKLKLYINPGTGYWGPPNRFTVASEITLLNCHFHPSKEKGV